MAFNDHQLEIGGDPFVGAKLGNLLQAVGYRDITTEVVTIHLDNRAPGERARAHTWRELERGERRWRSAKPAVTTTIERSP